MVRNEKPKQTGIVFPSGSSAEVMKAALAASVTGVDDETANRVIQERLWRNNYMPHLVSHVEACLTSADAAVQISKQGLAYIYENFRFAKEDGQTITIQEAMTSPENPCPFQTVNVQGSKDSPENFNFGTVKVPWSFSTQVGERISGLDLELELVKAAQQGLMEPSVIEAIRFLNHDQSWSKKIADTCFVALGGGSAMGPTLDLLSLGATVVAIDVAIPAMWQRLIEAAQKLPGTLVFPVRAGIPANASNEELASAAGCNMIAEAPEILQWLKTMYPERHHVVGLYAYADAAEFVRVALAMDAIAKGMIDSRPQGRVSIAYMCSPTDVFGIPVEAREESKRKATVQGMGSLRRRMWQVPLRTIGMGKIMAPNNEGTPEPRTKGRPVVDCIVPQQGPNYAFAKRLQHWRAVAEQAQGVIVSANIAPASHTYSVRKNKTFAAAYDGSRRFGCEIFHPQTSSALMTTLMLHDIYFHDRKPSSDHPFGLFMHGAVHGGIWRQPYLFRSVVMLAAVIELAFQNKVPHIAGAVVAAAVMRSKL
eukprot:TRINITY_DN61161_c0_g1_i1.p1 TRINITY_DN61161_c0_g1~~TRINITY_DN61161_c0_g1_i1.p1  ORF type:complete len:561 (-),score=82.79 TRINITY_DN61161_c0_g1_i1:13-1623(-)